MLLKWSRKKKVGIVAAAVVVMAAGGIGIYQLQTDGEEKVPPVTKEVKVESGNLTVGITESGNVSISSLTQSFPFDWSGSSSGSSTVSENSDVSGGASGAGSAQSMAAAGGGQMQSGSGSQSSGSGTGNSTGNSTTSSSSDASLIVEKVYVSNGQAVQEGDSLLKLTRDSVEEVKSIYQSNYEAAKETLREAELEYKSGKLTAEYEYKKKIAEGENAKTTYEAELASLSSNVESARSAYQEATKGIKKLPAQISDLKKQIRLLNKETGAISVADVGQNDSSKNSSSSLNNSAVSSEGTTNSSSSASSLEQQLLQKEQQLEQYRANLSSLKTAYHAAKKAETTGKIEAKSVYEQTLIDSKNAKTVYQTTLSSLKEELKSARDDYEEAEEEKKEFTQYVKDRIIKAEYTGTLVSVGYQKGDSLSTGTDIAAYQDSEGVTISVSVAQDDVANIQVGDEANIYLSAFEDKLFHGSVTSISTTSTGESTVSYPVEVTMTSDVSKVYSGMSSEVTFVSKEVENVLYVSNKAIVTEGTKSYVTLKKEDGSIEKRMVETGFSDGHNVDIISGLEEGDTVLIESQVSQ